MFGGKILAMFGVGMSELIVIMVIVLIIFGAGKLPEIGAALGKGIRNFKSGVSEDESDKKTPLPKDEQSKNLSDED